MATLAETTLSQTQRAALEHFVEVLRERLGDDLTAVWLYGSHARGEGKPVDSDVDVMVIARGSGSGDVVSEARSAADRAVDSYSGIMAHTYTPEKLAERRRIEAFYVKEIDRDKVVLYGDEQGGAHELPGLEADGMRERTREHLELSRTRLEQARGIAEIETPDIATSVAYYSALNAARAALSEEDVFARTHSGTWDQMRIRFFRSGRIEEQLGERAAKLQKAREEVDYEGLAVPEEDARAALATATDFLAAVEAVIAAAE